MCQTVINAVAQSVQTVTIMICVKTILTKQDLNDVQDAEPTLSVVSTHIMYHFLYWQL